MRKQQQWHDNGGFEDHWISPFQATRCDGNDAKMVPKKQGRVTTQRHTLPKTNTSPENRPYQKESSIPTIHFQVRAASFREGNPLKPKEPRCFFTCWTKLKLQEDVDCTKLKLPTMKTCHIGAVLVGTYVRFGECQNPVTVCQNSIHFMKATLMTFICHWFSSV